MAGKKSSAEKRHAQSEVRRLHNKAIKSTCKTYAKQFVEAVHAKKEQKIISGISDEISIFTKGSAYWESIIIRGTEQKVLNYADAQMLQNAIKYCNGLYAQLSKFQLKEIARITAALKENGIE